MEPLIIYYRDNHQQLGFYNKFCHDGFQAGLTLWIIIYVWCLSGYLWSEIGVSHGEVPQFDQIGPIKNLIATKLQLVEGRKPEIKFNYYFWSSSLHSEYTSLMSCKISTSSYLQCRGKQLQWSGQKYSDQIEAGIENISL